MWEMGDAAAAKLLGNEGWPIRALCVLDDDTYIATGARDGTVLLRKIGTSSQMVRLHNGTVTLLALAPGGSLVATGDYDGVIMLWDPHNPTGAARLCNQEE